MICSKSQAPKRGVQVANFNITKMVDNAALASCGGVCRGNEYKNGSPAGTGGATYLCSEATYLCSEAAFICFYRGFLRDSLPHIRGKRHSISHVFVNKMGLF